VMLNSCCVVREKVRENKRVDILRIINAEECLMIALPFPALECKYQKQSKIKRAKHSV